MTDREQMEREVSNRWGEAKPGEHVFTPHPERDPETERLNMRIGDEDHALVSNWPRGPEAPDRVITDLLTGKRWLVRRMPCTIPECWCAAQVVEEVKPN